jgi:hypothetical protein
VCCCYFFFTRLGSALARELTSDTLPEPRHGPTPRCPSDQSPDGPKHRRSLPRPGAPSRRKGRSTLRRFIFIELYNYITLEQEQLKMPYAVTISTN